MDHAIGEKRVKILLKRLLCHVEACVPLQELGLLEFNSFRKMVFRRTFEAFRVGIIGIDSLPSDYNLFESFFGWLYTDSILPRLQSDVRDDISAEVLKTTLEAFRLGGMVGDEIQYK